MQPLSELKKEFEHYLNAQKFERKPISLYQPFDYLLQLGGKRIRPTLLLAANQLFQGKLEDALPAAMSIELFHNFTLIHDDIMDEAELRRGHATIHKKFGTNTAILSGDAMMVIAYQYLLNSKNAQESIITFNKTAIEVCEGQQLDMDFEQYKEVAIPEYLEMIRLKTAVLLAASLKIGAISANSSKKEQEHIYQFGKSLGISFQIMDDVLDSFPESEKFGKKIGGDIIQNKKTYLLLQALEDASDHQKNELTSWINKSSFDVNEKVASVQQIFVESGVVEKAKSVAEEYYQDAIDSLKILGEKYDISSLLKFSEELLLRKT